MKNNKGARIWPTWSFPILVAALAMSGFMYGIYEGEISDILLLTIIGEYDVLVLVAYKFFEKRFR